MPVRLNPRKSLKTQSGDDLNGAMRSSLYDVANQLRRPSTAGSFQQRLPVGQKAGDQTTQVAQDGTFSLSVFDAMGNPMTARLARDINSNSPFKEGAADPVLADYPNDGDNGWYYNTTSGQLWYVRNRAGTLIYLNFVAIAGTITVAQHGQLGGDGGTDLHDFTQITGSITGAQHGNLAGGALHAVASTSAAGFLSTTFFDLLDGATSAATNNALVRRGAAGAANFAGTCAFVNVNASGNYQVDGTQVVTNQQAAIADATTGGGATAANCATKINEILGALRTHGLINT